MLGASMASVLRPDEYLVVGIRGEVPNDLKHHLARMSERTPPNENRLVSLYRNSVA